MHGIFLLSLLVLLLELHCSTSFSLFKVLSLVAAALLLLHRTQCERHNMSGMTIESLVENSNKLTIITVR